MGSSSSNVPNKVPSKLELLDCLSHLKQSLRYRYEPSEQKQLYIFIISICLAFEHYGVPIEQSLRILAAIGVGCQGKQNFSKSEEETWGTEPWQNYFARLLNVRDGRYFFQLMYGNIEVLNTLVKVTRRDLNGFDVEVKT